MIITLALLVFMAGNVNPTVIGTATAPSVEDCLRSAGKFLARDPAEFGGVALGAGCIATPAGRPS